MKRLHTWLRALGIALLVLLAAEQVAAPRLRPSPRIFEEHPTRFWTLTPGVSCYDRQSASTVRVNHLGLRGGEPDLSGPRMLLLGDSCIFGAGVTDAETLDRCLEAELRTRTGRPWVVLNGGVPGYSTFQGVDLLEDLGPEIRADVVVLAYLYGDRRWDRCPDHERQAGPLVPAVRRLLWKSALYRVLRDGWLGTRPEVGPLEDGPRSGNLYERVPPVQYRKNMERLAERARAFGASRVVFLRLPNRGPRDGRSEGQEAVLLRMGLASGGLVDALGRWERVGLLHPHEFLPGDLLHLSARGNRHLARTLADEFEARAMLPDRP